MFSPSERRIEALKLAIQLHPTGQAKFITEVADKFDKFITGETDE